MSQIYIRPDEVMGMSAKIRSMSGKAGSISKNVRSIMNSLDWEVSAKGGVASMAAGIGSRADRLAEKAEALGNGGNRAALEFRNADMLRARSMEGLLNNMRLVSTTVAALTLASNINMGARGNSTKDFFQKASDWFKGAGEALKKFGDSAADGINGLLDRIKDFFKKNKVLAGNMVAADGMDNNPFDMDIEAIRAGNPTMAEILKANPNFNKDK